MNIFEFLRFPDITNNINAVLFTNENHTATLHSGTSPEARVVFDHRQYLLQKYEK